MPNIFVSAKHFIFRHKIISVIVGVLIIGFVLRAVFTKSTDGQNSFVTVTRADISQEVSVTGRLKPASEVELAFERGGRIGKLYAAVGDLLKPGQIVASVAADDLYAQARQANAGVMYASAQLKQYQAALESQKLKLTQVQSGTRMEEIKIAETAVANAMQSVDDAQTNYQTVTAKAETDLANVYNDVPDALSDAYKDADDAVRIKLAGIFSYDSSSGYKVKFNSCDPQLDIDAIALRLTVESELVAWQKELLTLSAPPAGYDYDAEIQTTLSHLEDMKRFLEKVNGLLTTGCTLNDSTLDDEREDVSAGRSSLNSSSATLNTQRQAITAQKAINANTVAGAEAKLNDAKNALKTAQDQLALKRAGSTPEDIAVQEAAVHQAEANVEAQRAQVQSAQANADSAAAQVEKTIIRSPIAGTLTKQDAKVGEIVAANANLVSVMSFEEFQIDANVPEVDIGDVKVGNPVHITIDAFSGDTFIGKVVEVDPAEQVIDGVVNFKVTVTFDKAEDRFKSGLTANLEIQTAHMEGALILPQYAIAETDQGTFVRVMEGSTEKDVPIKTGIRSKEGNVEIISGVSEGEQVLNIGFKK